MPRLIVLTSILLLWAAAPCAATRYDVRYRAEPDPQNGVIHVEIRMDGKPLPSRLVFRVDPKRHRAFESTDPLEIAGDRVTWRPRGKFSRFRYDFVVDHERASGRFDSRMTKDWAIFRGDKLVPAVAVTAARSASANSSFELALPSGWTAATPYASAGETRFAFDDPERRFDRPEGWMLVGNIGSRNESIAGIRVVVAAPSGGSVRRQDALAFLNWNLPHLVAVFPAFTRRLLIVSAGDPMWRGGLSGPGSVFVHADRPLVSENRTSTLLHELVHVAMGIHGDRESDWIVEGFAEYYSIETLRRSGGISSNRYEDAMKRLSQWSARAGNLFIENSTAAQTARGVMVLKATDAEIRAASGGRASLDDMARELAANRGEVSLELLQSLAAKHAGRPVRSLERSRLLQREPANPQK
jgi:predicted metalloprotease with PDZ domain